MNSKQTHKAINNNKINAVAIKLFFEITQEWNLTEKQRCNLAGLETEAILIDWRNRFATGQSIKLSKDTIERLSYVASIYKALQILFTDPNQWKDWMHKPNRDLGGISALDSILTGKVEDLASVRRYLNGWLEDQYH